MRAFVLSLSLLAGCTSENGLTEVRASADPLQWLSAGFIELVTPIRPPTTRDGRGHISVLLKVPRGAHAQTRTSEGVLEVSMPAGTIAVRVEYQGAEGRDLTVAEDWRVLDVRQFEWASDGSKRCSVLRPAGDGALLGLGWKCGQALDRKAGAALVELAAAGRIAGTSRLAKINECMTCHLTHRDEDRDFNALVQRGTDGEGLFSVPSMLRDEDPVERYREVDANMGDPLMRPVCPGSTPEHPPCADSKRPRLALAVREGVARGDLHTERLCAARRALAAVLDVEGRAWLRAQSRESCGTP